MRKVRSPLLAVLTAICFAVPAAIDARQQTTGGRGQPGAQTARSAAAVDLSGTWVSVITEDWVNRMVTPPKGAYGNTSTRGEGGPPLNAEGIRVTNTWDPEKDDAAGEQCKGYGAVGVTRLPGYLRFNWQDDSTLKMELTAGNQVRLFHFGSGQTPAGDPTLQGFSVAGWEYAVTPSGEPRKGNLKVVTTRLRPQYSRKNGVPVSGNAQLTEYYHQMRAPNGDQWLTLILELRDSQYLREPWVASYHFKRVPDSSPWKPEACSAK